MPDAPHASDVPRESARLLITVLGIGQICSWGSFYYSFPLIAEAMGRDLGWSKTTLYGAATLGLVLAALAAYPVGVAIDRGQGRRVMGLASLASGLLFILWSQTASVAVFYLIVPAIGALQAALLYEPAFAIVARRVGPMHARAGITELTLWGGFASTVFIPLAQWLLDVGGWREALIVLGLINGLLCAAGHWLVIRPGRDRAPALDAVQAQAHATADRQVVREALRHPVFWGLLCSFTAYAAVFAAFIFHMYPLLLERGLDTTAVVQAMMLFGPAQVAGRIAITVFARRASMRSIGTAVTAVFPLVFAALLVLPMDFLVAASICIVYGAMNGIFTIVRGMAVPEMLCRRAYGTINGLITAPVLFARALAPAGAAALWALGESYTAVLIVSLAGALLAALSFWFAARSRGQRLDPD